ncbi:urea carboxylase-associated family protein [Alteromonas pelagimontana]|uniref:Urea carboxylase-associated family protein n=1 Tax=Alteromonas pelagimontana TaxID=1858656 RepID=A0A6M4MEY9_9ALTE|nr:urea carboxylase-associated family protein [Alteromonas pelagimontana]QJR81659.1 urea carboxylase-associated family protein [Alteromonas pelagimontana]
MTNTIPPRSGTAFKMKQGECLKVVDPEGEQVADLYAFNENDHTEFLSSGRSLDYNESVEFGKGAKLYSNNSNVMFEIVEDTVGVHDFTLTPCSVDTFKHFYPNEAPVPGCFGNLAAAFEQYGIPKHLIGTTFNTFMKVDIDREGKISVLPPVSKAGDYTVFRAKMDMIVGLTACSAGESNNFSYKPIEYEIIAQ